MNPKLLGLVLVPLLAGGAMPPAWAQAPAPPPAPAAAAQVVETPGVRRATLPNGMRIVVVPNRLAPVVATSLNYMAGSTDSPPGFPGTAHAIEHMMFRGSADLGRDALSELGAVLGGNYNASTAETLTQYTYTVPAADLPLVLRIEAGRMAAPLVTQADWAQERGAIEQEVSRNLSSPTYNAYAAVQERLFAGTPYEWTALGTRPSFDATDAALLKRFHDAWYTPNNAILVIAGDVDADAALAAAQAAFAAIPSRPLPPHAPVAVTGRPDTTTIQVPANLPYVLAGLAFRMPGLRAPDFAVADVLGDVLDSKRWALKALVPEGRALAARYEFSAKADVGFGFALSAVPAGADPEAALADLRRVLAMAAAGEFPDGLVEDSKRQEIAQLAFETDSIAGLARAWSRALAVAGLESPGDIARAYAAVTPADVRRMAQALLDPAVMVPVVLTPRRTGAAPTQATFGAPESHAATPEVAVTLPDWATVALAQAAPALPAGPPFATILPNGLRLIVQPETVGKTVSVFGRVRQEEDLQQPPGKDGVATLAGRLLDDGSAARPRLEREAAMDAIAASHAVGFSFSLRTLTPHFEEGMRLLADAELQPAFPASAFEVKRRQLAQSLAGLPDSPDHQADRALEMALLPAGDPALREATPETVMALTPDDVKAFYAAAFRPDLATIVVLGDVTTAEAQRVVEATFGGWRATGPTPVIDLPPVAPNPPGEARIPEPGRLQDSVTLAATLAMPVTHPDRYALLLGNTILGGDFSSRLYRDLRVRTGYVYSVRSGLDWTRSRARHTIEFGADGQNLASARALVRQNLVAMQTEPVTPGELARARAQVLRRLPMQRASIGGIASLYLRQDELGLPLDSQRIAAERYATVTAEDIRRAFAEWLRPDSLVQVVKGPAP